VQLAAFELDHVSVALPSAATVLGLTEIVTLGAEPAEANVLNVVLAWEAVS
jgi:hypothetical protein